MTLVLKYCHHLRHKFLLAGLILLALITTSCSFLGSSNPNPITQKTPTPIPSSNSGYFPVGSFHVQGNQLVDSTGHAFLLRGAQIEGAFNVQHQGTSELAATQNLNSTTFNVMHQQWNMNALRIPLCDYLWQANPTNYLQRLDTVVQQAIAAKLVVVLDLHEDGHCGTPPTLTARLPLPLSQIFWQAIASHYKDNQDIIFDVYNEPTIVAHVGNDHHQSNADWQQWLHGGTINGQQYLGMQNLVDTIRSTGAKQVIAVEGLSIGTSFYKIGNNLINDPNVIYEVHMYFSKKRSSSTIWDKDFGFLSSRVPVYVGEWAFLPYNGNGTNCPLPPALATQKIVDFMNYMASNQISWTAWAFMPNRMLQTYNGYVPTTLNGGNFACAPGTTAGMGQLVKQYLTGHP